MLRLADAGIDVADIGQRFHRSPEHIERLMQLAQLPGRSATRPASGLRPLERCILSWRAKGAPYDEIGPRLGRTPGFVARVEAFAHHKLADR